MCWWCLHEDVCPTPDLGPDCDCMQMKAVEFAAKVLSPPEPATLAVVPLIRQWYRLGEGFSSGGPLHAELDDYNVDSLSKGYEDRLFDWCPELKSPEAVTLGSEIIRLLRSISISQRLMAVEAAHEEGLADAFGIVTDWPCPYGAMVGTGYQEERVGPVSFHLQSPEE